MKKRVLALVLAASMVMSVPVIVSAEEVLLNIEKEIEILKIAAVERDVNPRRDRYC